MQFEIIEYKRDDDGKEVVAASYNVEQIDLSKTIDRLNEDVQRGRISNFGIASV